MENFTFYVCGPWAERPFVREVIQKLNQAGWATNSRWAEPDNPDVADDDPERDQKLRAQAIRDVEDVVKADGLIYVNAGYKSEGKATELGISIAMLKPIVIVGEGLRSNNIFLNLNIPAHRTVEEAIEWLEGEGQLYLSWVESQQTMHLHASQLVDDEGEDLSDVVFPSE